MLKNYSDIKCLVKNEVDSIRKRDGELAKTAYVVMEVALRLKTLAPWDGYDSHKPMAQNLRPIVESVVTGKVNPLHVPPKEDLDMDAFYISPNEYDSLEDTIGDKKRVGKSVDALPHACRKEKLKKRLKQVS